MVLTKVKKRVNVKIYCQQFVYEQLVLTTKVVLKSYDILFIGGVVRIGMLPYFSNQGLLLKANKTVAFALFKPYLVSFV